MAGDYDFPPDLRQLVREHADLGTSRLESIAGQVRRLSRLFNGQEPWDPSWADEPEALRAYLAYFVPVNIPKVRWMLSEWLRGEPARWAGKKLRALDLGSGPGTASLALLDLVRDLPSDHRPTSIELLTVDESREALLLAERLVAGFTSATDLSEVTVGALRLDAIDELDDVLGAEEARAPFSVVFAANVLCEIIRRRGLDAADEIVRRVAAKALEKDGALLVLEPGLRDFSRHLSELRDRILASDLDLHVRAPCVHTAPCPALATQRDWCIADRPWNPSPEVQALDRLTGLRKSSLKFAYLVLSPDRGVETPAGRWRVVSDVLARKGDRRVYLCGDDRWCEVGVLDRDRSLAATGLRDLLRGDLVDVSGLEKRPSGLHRTGPATEARRLDPLVRPPRTTPKSSSGDATR